MFWEAEGRPRFEPAFTGIPNNCTFLNTFLDLCITERRVGQLYVYDSYILGSVIPVGVRFFAHVQTGPAAHPASCKMGTGSFSRIKRPGRVADHPSTPSAEVENE
jgi:hypothetical protein